MTVSIAAGLSDADVAARIAEGKTNDVPARASRSVSDIVRSNVFTRINAILGVLFMLVLATGSLINGLFGLLIIANSGIGIIQELRAKKTLDNLAIVGQAKPTVRRQSGTTQVAPNEVVLDDVIELGPGDQIVVDGEMLEASNLEVDESLLTGESVPVDKQAVGAAGPARVYGLLRKGRIAAVVSQPCGVRSARRQRFHIHLPPRRVQAVDTDHYVNVPGAHLR